MNSHDMRNKLLVTFEGKTQVKDIKKHLLVSEYELFTKEPIEPISHMFKRFNHIITPIKLEELGRMILKSFPLDWKSIVKAINEGGKVETFTVDELFGTLMV